MARGGEGLELLDDRELVERARRDPDACAVLYRRYLDRIHAFAHRRTGSREVAEDVTAATFERALRALPTFSWQGGGFAPWLFRIAANELADHHRAIARSRSPRGQAGLRLLGDEPTVEDPLPTDPADTARLRAAIDTLRPRHQQAITLRYLADLSTAEAARAMGCSRGTFAVTLHRAMRALRAALEASGTEGAEAGGPHQ